MFFAWFSYASNYCIREQEKATTITICDSWKSDSCRESNQEKKGRSDTKNEAKAIKNDNFKGGNIKKPNIGQPILSSSNIK